MSLAPFNRVRQIAAAESDSGLPINAQQGAGLEREMEGLRQAELNRGRVLSRDELDVLQNAHLRDPYAESQIPPVGTDTEESVTRALGAVDHNPSATGSDMKFIEKLHEKFTGETAEEQAAPKRRGKASEAKAAEAKAAEDAKAAEKPE